MGGSSSGKAWKTRGIFFYFVAILDMYSLRFPASRDLHAMKVMTCLSTVSLLGNAL